MKRLLLVLMLILGAVMITSRPVATYAYTDEEKTAGEIMAVFAWLSTNKSRGENRHIRIIWMERIDVPEADAYMGKNQKK